MHRLKKLALWGFIVSTHIWQHHNKVMEKSFLRSIDNLFHGDAAGVVAILDILCNGAVKQHRLLRHNANLRP